MPATFSPSGLELDCLWVAIDSALRIRKRHQLFSWSQGVLQSILRHDVLVCALASTTPGAVRAEVVAAAQTGADRLDRLRTSQAALVARLTRLWDAGGQQPLLVSLASPVNGFDAPLWETMRTATLRNLAVHGTFDRNGNPQTLFAFADLVEPLGGRELAALELVVPYLHTAWLRVQLDGQPPVRPRAAVTDLTEREIEILRYLQIGRSNTDIGRALDISPLTVKNHVQKILRKLNAQNRTEAVAKGLSLEILQVTTRRAAMAGEGRG